MGHGGTSAPGTVSACYRTYLHVFKGILLSYASQNVLFAAFLELAREEQLIENIVCLGEGENYVQLANIAIVFVHLFNITVDNFEGNEFVIV
jgi:hypothetical protein